MFHSLEQFGLVVKLNKWLDEGLIFIGGGKGCQRLGLKKITVLVYFHIGVNLHSHIILRQIWELEILIISISLSEGISLAGE
jgi:hypothetical protein|tara:strand:+ start:1947 stop:2192 length:246 start_codon:yes stop_codon:yes gene_type:complete